MSTNKHTPGSWQIVDRMRTAINSDEKHVAMVNYNQKYITDEEHEANVRLIVAAPEMLSILERLVTYYSPGENRAEAIFKITYAEELISKIKGI